MNGNPEKRPPSSEDMEVLKKELERLEEGFKKHVEGGNQNDTDTTGAEQAEKSTVEKLRDHFEEKGEAAE